MSRILFLSLMIVSLFPVQSLADTTGILYKQCLDLPRKKHAYYYCVGYMAGVHDIIQIKRQNLDCGETKLAQISNETLIAQFMEWARQHSERWDEPAYKGMVSMIDVYYPCPNEGYDYELEDPSR